MDLRSGRRMVTEEENSAETSNPPQQATRFTNRLARTIFRPAVAAARARRVAEQSSNSIPGPSTANVAPSTSTDFSARIASLLVTGSAPAIIANCQPNPLQVDAGLPIVNPGNSDPDWHIRKVNHAVMRMARKLVIEKNDLDPKDPEDMNHLMESHKKDIEVAYQLLYKELMQDLGRIVAPSEELELESENQEKRKGPHFPARSGVVDEKHRKLKRNMVIDLVGTDLAFDIWLRSLEKDVKDNKVNGGEKQAQLNFIMEGILSMK